MWVRVLAAIALLSAAGALLLPGIVGYEVEAGYAKALKERLPPSLKASGRFQRGWFHSTADTTLTLPGSPSPLVLHHRIKHLALSDQGSPLAARIETQIEDGAGVPSSQNHLITEVTPQGLVSTRFSLADQSLPHPTLPLSVRVKQAKGEVQFQEDSASLSLRFTAARIALALADQSIVIADDVNGRWTISLAERRNQGWMDVGQLLLPPDSQTPENRMTTVSISAEHAIRQGLLDGGVTLAADSVSTASRQAGPIEVRINYTDWAVTPALHLITAYTGAKSPPIADPQSREALLRLLAGGPKVAIEQLYLFTPQGEFDGTLLLDFPKGSPLFKPNTSLRKAQARGTLRIDDTLAQEIGGALLALLIQETFPADPQGLDPTWIQQKVIHYLQQAERDGILHRNDGLLSSSFQLDDAKLSINGIPQPLPFTPSSHSVN